MKNTIFERLTFKERNGHFGLCGMNETNEEKKIIQAVHRLMQYEETGLSPEQIRMLQKNNDVQYISFDKNSRAKCLHFLGEQNELIEPDELIELISVFAEMLSLKTQCPCNCNCCKSKNKTLKGGD